MEGLTLSRTLSEPPAAGDHGELLVWDHRQSIKRAFMSKQEEKVNFWLRFGFFYLCNGRHITELLPAQPSGARRRTPGRIEVRLCAGRYKDKK